MRLGFDLDNVIIHYPPVVPEWVFDTFYKEKDHTTLRYRIPGKIEQKGRQLLHLPFLRLPIKRNLSFLQKLHNENKHELYLISSRFGFLKRQTHALAKKYGLTDVFTELFFNFENEQPHFFKDMMIKKKKIERYIDDDLALVTYLAHKNPQTLFFWYNHTENKKILPNLFATTDIQDIANKR